MRGTTGNTILLTITNVFNRVVGFASRIILIRIVGGEIIGLWQMTMPLYLFFLVVASAGLSVATSRLIAEQRAQGNAKGMAMVFHTALIIAIITGLTATLLLVLTAKFFSANILNDPRTTPALLILAPSLPLVAVASVYRGYFQGMGQMKIVSTALVVEELAQVLATVSLVIANHGRSPGILVASFAAASLLSEVAGLGVYLTAFPLLQEDKPGSRNKVGLAMAGRVLGISIPTATGRLLGSLTRLSQSIIIPACLRASGWTASQAAEAYGELTGMAFNLLFLPSLFTVALATSLLPQATTAIAKAELKQARAIFLRSLNLTAIIGLPVAAVLASLGEPLCLLLFNSLRAGRLLQVLASGGFLLYTQQIAAAMLQSLGKPTLPLVSLLAGTGTSLALFYVLTPYWQMAGIASGLVGGWAISGALSLYFVEGRLPFMRYFWPGLLKLCLAALFSGLGAHQFYLHLLARSGYMLPSLIGALGAAAGIYLLLSRNLIGQACRFPTLC